MPGMEPILTSLLFVSFRGIVFCRNEQFVIDFDCMKYSRLSSYVTFVIEMLCMRLMYSSASRPVEAIFRSSIAVGRLW